jgi:hypothetical protein
MSTSPSSSTRDGMRPSGLISRIASASANVDSVLRANGISKRCSAIATRRTYGESY